MMLRYVSLFGIIMLVLFLSCKNGEEKFNDEIRKLLTPFRNGPIFMDENKKLAHDLYHALRRSDAETVKNVLGKGADPNYCLGECGWVDSNPLNVNVESVYGTYYARLDGKIIPDPTPDEVILNALLEAGADINRRPYIWQKVNLSDNAFISRLWKSVIINGEPLGVEADIKETFIEDENRLLEAFLKAGADPDKLGHPYPFSSEAMYARITDEQANEYFAQGSRAINVAIEKGIVWESQVDLLLQYTSLDEESLRAAERSNDPAMVEKIQKLWKAREEK